MYSSMEPSNAFTFTCYVKRNRNNKGSISRELCSPIFFCSVFLICRWHWWKLTTHMLLLLFIDENRLLSPMNYLFSTRELWSVEWICNASSHRRLVFLIKSLFPIFQISESVRLRAHSSHFQFYYKSSSSHEIVVVQFKLLHNLMESLTQQSLYIYLFASRANILHID